MTDMNGQLYMLPSGSW